MPGFIDTHWHLWNTIQKNMLSKGIEYFPLKAALVQHYTTEDFYRSNRLALAEAVNGGFTTVNNFAHNTRTPAHVDAELRAMAESGLRGRYSYGWIDPIPDKQVTNLEDIARVKRQWFGADSPMRGRIDMGMALRGPMYTPSDIYAAEFRAAKSMGLPAILHVGQTKRRYAEVSKLHAEGFIERSTILVHGIVATPADRRAMAQAGASLSISPQSEMRDQEDGDFREQLLQMIAAEINVCLSIDSSVLGAASMFDQMSSVWYLGIPWRGTPSEKLPYIDFSDVLAMATINGARAMGIEDKTGSLTPGKRADILMIRANDLNMVPLGNVHTALVRSAQNHNIDSVIADGVFRKRGGRILGVDVEQIKREAEQSLYDIRTRAGGRWAPPARG
jgi:cytosine/adenosine deaminase-related metal-dependent hydrolase